MTLKLLVLRGTNIMPPIDKTSTVPYNTECMTCCNSEFKGTFWANSES